MKSFKSWAWLLLIGSLWGMNEVVVGGSLYKNNTPYNSILLTATAFFILAIGRGILNKPGSSTAIAIFAAIFKLANAAPFYCHLLGIFTLGLTFDIFSTFLMKNEDKVSYRSSVSGVLSAYGGNALFAVIMTYIIRYEYWIMGGLPKVLNHIFVSGSYTALLAIVAVPMGYWIGILGRTQVERRPQLVYRGTLLGVIILWMLARMVG